MSTLGFPNEAIASAVRIALSPALPNQQQMGQLDTFLTTAVLRILNNTAVPIHTVNRTFEQSFRMPFRAFRQASLQSFLEVHPEFELFDVYVCPSNLRAHLPLHTGVGGRYFTLCDHIEEQEVVLWRLREELSSLETSLVGHASNSALLGGFVAESDDVHDCAQVLTFKVVAVTPNGTELPIMIQPRTVAGDLDDDITTARKALTRIVQREMAILRKTDETVGFEMTDHKHQIASLKVRIDAEVERLCQMYDEATVASAAVGPVLDMAPLPQWEGQRAWTSTRASRTETREKRDKRDASEERSRRAPRPVDYPPPPGFHAPGYGPFPGYY